MSANDSEIMEAILNGSLEVKPLDELAVKRDRRKERMSQHSKDFKKLAKSYPFTITGVMVMFTSYPRRHWNEVR